VAIDSGRTELRRGEAVRVTLTVQDEAELELRGDLGVGLVCVESYEGETVPTQPDKAIAELGTLAAGALSDANPTVSSENQTVTFTSRAHEEWAPVDARAGSQELSFTVPLDAPYSYDGKILSFAWFVAARDRGHAEPDRMVVPIRVLP
jgi:hypothetical protein